MPKHITDAKVRILETTKKQLFEKGYDSVSLRGIAHQCSLGVGTIYNYFSCKDELIAEIILEDWMKTLEAMDSHIKSISTLEDGFICIYQDLCTFCNDYRELFHQAQDSVHAVQRYHAMLVKQIEERIHYLYTLFNETEQNDCITLFAELILISASKETVSQQSFRTLIHRFIRKESTYEQL